MPLCTYCGETMAKAASHTGRACRRPTPQEAIARAVAILERSRPSLRGSQTSYYCRCGSALSYYGTPAAVAELLAAWLQQLHTGEGHGPVTAREAARARAGATD